MQGVADRVMLGLLPSSHCAWQTALAALKDKGGCLHLHSNVKDSDEAAWSHATLVCSMHGMDIPRVAVCTAMILQHLTACLCFLRVFWLQEVRIGSVSLSLK